MKDISIELYSQKDNYKEIQEFFKFFLNYVKPDRMRIVASFTNKAYDKKFNEKSEGKHVLVIYTNHHNLEGILK